MHVTPLAISALAVFTEGPRHAYDVYATLRQRKEDRLVKISAGTLYHTVNRLAEDGMLEEVGTETAGNRPERTVFKITAAGRTWLNEQVRAMVREPVAEHPRFPVAIAELHNLPAAEAIDLLHERIPALDAEVAFLQSLHQTMRDRGVPERFGLENDLLITMTTAERDWCRRTAERLTTGELDWTAAHAHTKDLP